MATSNFLQFNPSAQNQETDAAFLADPQRTGGATVGATFPSPLANKLFFQWSTFIAAFGAMMAAKGYAMSDSSMATLQTTLANVQTKGEIPAALTPLAYSAAMSFDASASSGWQMTLNGNLSPTTISGITPGQQLVFIFAQDSVGGHTVAWPTSFVGARQPNPAPNAVSVFVFYADSLGIPRSAIPQIAVNNVTGARAYGTVYQNLTPEPMRVAVSGTVGSGGAVASAYIGSTSTPTQLVAQTARIAASGSDPAYAAFLSFDVPSGSYYVVTEAGGDTGGFTLISWNETVYV